eukprot:2783001-Ditylum_brightwellii.AAC.1
MGDIHHVELEDVLYIPDAPKSLISIAQWSEERKDNCGILSQGTYSIFMWKEDAHQKLVSHLIPCKIPIMPVNEGGSDKL